MVGTSQHFSKIGQYAGIALSYFIRNAFVYMFPIVLIFIEAIVRTAFSQLDLSYIGPTLASVGIGFILPLTVSKRQSANLPVNTIEELRKQGLIVIREKSANFTQSVLFFLAAITALWIWSLYLSIKSPNDLFNGWVPLTYIPGFTSYIVGVVLTEAWKKV